MLLSKVSKESSATFAYESHPSTMAKILAFPWHNSCISHTVIMSTPSSTDNSIPVEIWNHGITIMCMVWSYRTIDTSPTQRLLLSKGHLEWFAACLDEEEVFCYPRSYTVDFMEFDWSGDAPAHAPFFLIIFSVKLYTLFGLIILRVFMVPNIFWRIPMP